MTEIMSVIDLLTAYIAIWMPSLIAITGIVCSVITAFAKIKQAVAEMKNDETFKQLGADLKTALRDNKTLKEQNDILIDEIKKIKNYREHLND